MFFIGSLALYPQFRNSEHVLGLLNVCLHTAPFCASAQALLPGHQVCACGIQRTIATVAMLVYQTKEVI